MIRQSSITKQLITPRGGGVELDLTYYGYDGERLSAYQNYLGGGMLASVQNDCTINDWQENASLADLANYLKSYYLEQMQEAGFIDEYNIDTDGRPAQYPMEIA